MAVFINDEETGRLIAERKLLPKDYRNRLSVKSKRGHKESELQIKGENGSDFCIILRQSDFNPLDFSVILGWRVPNSSRVFRLRRYNGKSHEHTNKLEDVTFYDFHIHKATERYQDSGLREDGYAEPTDRYADISGAIECMIEDCGFELPPDTQGELFEQAR